MKIAAGILSLLLGLVVTFQSCAVSGLGAIAAPGSTTGALGTLVGILLIVAGAFAFGLPRVSMAISVAAAVLALIESSDFPDMRIYAVVCLGLAAMEFAASRKPKSEPPATKAL